MNNFIWIDVILSVFMLQNHSSSLLFASRFMMCSACFMFTCSKWSFCSETHHIVHYFYLHFVLFYILLRFTGKYLSSYSVTWIFKIGVTFQIKTTNMRSSYKIQFMKDETSDWSSLSQMFHLNKCLNQRNDWKYFTKNQILEKIFSDVWVAEFSFFLLSSPRSSSHDLSDGFCDQTNWTWCS